MTNTNARVLHCLPVQPVAGVNIRASPKTSVRQVICVKRIRATLKPATSASVSRVGSALYMRIIPNLVSVQLCFRKLLRTSQDSSVCV